MRLILGCRGDSFVGITLCPGVENVLIEDIDKCTREIQQLIRTSIPKNILWGDREIMLALMALNAKERGIVNIGLIQGFVAFHRTHELDTGDHIFIKLT